MNIAVKKALLLLFVSAIAGSLNCAFGQFIYLANGGNDVSAWRLDARTRVLTTVPGSPFAAGAAPVDIAVDPTSKFVYVANAASNDVSAYRIETSTGALLPVTRSPFAAGIAPAALEIDPTGRFVYVANSRSSDISAYTMDSATGALLPVPGSPFATQIVPSALVSDITGKFLYVTHSASGSASTYGIDPATGALTRVSANPFPANTVPLSRSGSGLLSPGLVEDRTGQVAYEANDQSHDLNLFAMDARTRAWTSVSGSPLDGLLKLDGRLKPRAIAISAASRTDTPPTGTALVTGFTSGALRNNFTGGFGMVFTVGATPLNVTALGRIYITGNTGSHTVKLVSASDAVDVPGGSVTIQLPSGQAGEFAYASLATPVTLDAGASYYLTSSETIDGDQFYDLGAVTTTGAVTVQSGVVLWTGGFIPLGSPGRSFVPVNFLYTLAP